MAAEPKHRVTKVSQAEPFGDLVAHLDELAADGWEPFHIHEGIMSGEPSWLVFSRRCANG